MRTPPLPTLLFCLLSLALSAQATRLFTIGPGKDYTRITDFPWEDLVAGDVVEIHHNGSAYREKFNVAAIGTVAAPVTVRGVPDAAGNLPVITGENAVSRPQLDYWNQYRAPIRIGEALVPLHGQTPSYIVIENLEIRSARAPVHVYEHGRQHRGLPRAHRRDLRRGRDLPDHSQLHDPRLRQWLIYLAQHV